MDGNTILQTTGPSSFNAGVEALLGMVTCRRVELPDDLEDVYRLRYTSYLREGAVAARPAASLSDRFDSMPNGWVFGVYLNNCLISTLRLSLATPACQDIPAMTVFADQLQSSMSDGKKVLDPTRFVIEADHARAYPKLPYVTLRMAWLASEYFDVDIALATVRTEHQAFYRRLFGHELVCPARSYPSLLKPVSLMMLDFQQARARGLRRYPFLRSTAPEREALFGPPQFPLVEERLGFEHLSA